MSVTVIDETNETKGNKMTNSKMALVRCKAFTNEPIRMHKVIVESDNTILVYDPIARHYTRCHCLSRQQISRIIKIARA